MSRVAVATACVALTLSAMPANSVAQLISIAALLNPEGSRLFPQPVIYPRHPGKPDPRWKNFDWHYMDIRSNSSKYRLYFYTGEEWSAKFAIPKINDQMESLSKVFGYTPTQQFSYLLFTSLREFRQANIFFISEGVQGITSTREATMAVPYWGQAESFEHVSKHELVHQFQVQKMADLSGAFPEEVMAALPLWFVEGMAEYYSVPAGDEESRLFVRDLARNPKPEHDYKMPKFFEDGQLNFINVYKVGQAKIAMLESKFGHGTVQRIFERCARTFDGRSEKFADIVATETGKSEEVIEKTWADDVASAYLQQSDESITMAGSLVEVQAAGENLDLFDISPDGNMFALREIDPLSGVTSIRVMDLRFPENSRENSIEAIHDNKPGALSLYFMQMPTFAISNNMIAYIVETNEGPEIGIRKISRIAAGFSLGDEHRLKIHRSGIVQAQSLAIAPNENKIAFVGLGNKGWANIFVIDIDAEGSVVSAARQITDEYYAWRTLSWSKYDGIIGSSNKTANGRYALFSVNPESGQIRQVTKGGKDHLAPDVPERLPTGAPGLSDTSSETAVYFQSWTNGTSGTPQIFKLSGGSIKRLTNIDSGLFLPKLRGGNLYAIGFRQGRYHLYLIPPEKFRKEIDSEQGEASAVQNGSVSSSWKARLADLPGDQVRHYRPFVSSGIRMDNLGGYFASGTVVAVGATMSDLMRNYSLSGEFSVAGSFRFTTADVFLTSFRGRSTWTLGGYHVVQPRLDSLFETNGRIRTYLHREFGVLGAIEEPLGGFSYVDWGLRISGVNRSDFNDPALFEQWEAQNPGLEFMLAPLFRFGYDRIKYEAYSGPLDGFAILLESDTGIFPERRNATQRFRLDVADYMQVTSRTILAIQGLFGVAFGGTFKNPFLVSSDDILRAYIFGDERLFGNYITALKSEFRFPIGTVFGFPPLRGLAAYDIGTVFQRPDAAINQITSSYGAGLSLNIAPVSFSFVMAYPIRTAPGPVDRPVLHFTFRYLYL